MSRAYQIGRAALLALGLIDQDEANVAPVGIAQDILAELPIGLLDAQDEEEETRGLLGELPTGVIEDEPFVAQGGAGGLVNDVPFIQGTDPNGREYTLQQVDVEFIRQYRLEHGFATLDQAAQDWANRFAQNPGERPHMNIGAFRTIIEDFRNQIQQDADIHRRAKITLRVADVGNPNAPHVITNRELNITDTVGQEEISALDQIRAWYTHIGRGLLATSNFDTIIEKYLHHRSPNKRNDIRVYLTIANPPTPDGQQQIFQDNEAKTCWTDALYTILTKRKDAMTSANRVRNHEKALDALKLLQEKYQNGVPESQEVMDEFCNKLKIRKLVLRNALNQDILFSCYDKYSWTGPIALQNVRSDHVVATAYDDIKAPRHRVSQEALHILREEWADRKDILLKMSTNGKGLLAIRAPEVIVSLEDPNHEAVMKFEERFDLQEAYIDGWEHPTLTQITKSAMHMNGCRDYTDPSNYEDIANIDQEKAYTQFKKSGYYKGFVYKFQCMAQFSTAEQEKAHQVMETRLGAYLITNINTTQCDDRFRQHLDKLAYFGQSSGFDTAEFSASWSWRYSPELTFLKSQGVTFDIMAGAFTNNPGDFDFFYEEEDGTVPMLAKDEDGTPLYSRWSGMCGCYNEYELWVLPDREERFANLLAARTDNPLTYNRILREIQTEVPKAYARHRMHILGQITAYARIGMMRQLLNIDPSNVIRVNVDGVYLKEPIGDDQLVCKFRVQESKRKIPANAQWDTFTSDPKIWRGYRSLPEFHDLMLQQHVLYIGAAGTGKSHQALEESSCPGYVAPPWSLAVEKAESTTQKLISTVYALACNPGNPVTNTGRYRCFGRNAPATIICDECTMLTQNQYNSLIEIYPYSRIIFIGDILFAEHQLPGRDEPTLFQIPMQLTIEEEGTPAADFKQYFIDGHYREFTTLWRFKDDQRMIDLVERTRQLILDGEEFVAPEDRTLTPEEAMNRYNPKEDLIICSRRKRKDTTKGKAVGVERFNDLALRNQDAEGALNPAFEKVYRYEIRRANSPGRIRVVNTTVPVPGTYRGKVIFMDEPYKSKAKKKDSEPKYRLAYATTMHSAQGQTIKDGKVFVDTTRRWDKRMTYVAISRVTNYDQLYFICE